ncbi:hypothetical protein B0H12DRAFT_1070650 [Mycena haematopus]|nr:hypothetical protein B0H12DRAFT_1070650 [Mycena haematopus]
MIRQLELRLNCLGSIQVKPWGIADERTSSRLRVGEAEPQHEARKVDPGEVGRMWSRANFTAVDFASRILRTLVPHNFVNITAVLPVTVRPVFLRGKELGDRGEERLIKVLDNGRVERAVRSKRSATRNERHSEAKYSQTIEYSYHSAALERKDHGSVLALGGLVNPHTQTQFMITHGSSGVTGDRSPAASSFSFDRSLSRRPSVETLPEIDETRSSTGVVPGSSSPSSTRGRCGARFNLSSVSSALMDAVHTVHSPNARSSKERSDSIFRGLAPENTVRDASDERPYMAGLKTFDDGKDKSCWRKLKEGTSTSSILLNVDGVSV